MHLSSVIERRDSSFSTQFSDRDFYRFNAVIGQTYVVELFDVDSSLEMDEGDNCSYDYRGLGLTVYNRNIEEKEKRCEPYGVGNVHNYLWLDGLSGVTYIKVQPNANTVSGKYSIRVLPKHDEPGAVWDKVTFEPNNRIANAYAIKSGMELTSKIEERNVNFSTISADIDWYRFEAIAGKTYQIELFDVD